MMFEMQDFFLNNWDDSQENISYIYNQNYFRCCRMHDFCPDKIKPGRSRDGLNNEDIVTK